MCMTSCKKDEPTDKWILGKWYMEKDKHGTLGEGDAAVEYEKVVLCGLFEEGNKGFWALIYVDKDNRAINPDNAYAYYANCTYTVKDKTVAVKLTANYLPTSQKEWTLNYDGDCLETMYDNGLIDLKRITTAQDNQFIKWMQQLGFGADIPDMLFGEFSVSATEKVQFSKGNLQYQASTKSWRFAENQYDMIGDDNKNISDSYSGWIDLFGWGTGNNPTNTSTSDSDYATFNDWGNNIGEGWRTLNKDEWIYLFCGRTDAAHLFGMGSVNGVNGTIVLPDDWAGAKFTDTENGLGYSEQEYYSNNAGTSYSFHTYTAEQWKTMEEAGAVFLPAPGNRNGTEVINVNEAGFYWSATSFDESNAYFLYVSAYGLNPHYSNGRHNCISVRLVHEGNNGQELK